MKKSLLVLLALVLSAPAFAAKEEAGDVGDGCGLGWQVTSKRTMSATTTRGTTNGVVPPAFGMTSGTIGCAQHPIAQNETGAAVYAFNNYDSLTADMAQGSGEYVAAFAQSMGCDSASVESFGRMTQAQYSNIVDADAVQMYKNVKAQVKSNPSLASSCSI